MKKATIPEIERFKEGLSQPLPPPLRPRIVESLYRFELPVFPSEIWPYLIDTSRMNKDLGFPPRKEEEINGENHVSTKTLGRKEEWIEKPWVWIFEKEVQNHRLFKKGWMAEQRGVFRVETAPGNKTVVDVYFRWAFDGWFSHFLFSLVPDALAKKFETFFAQKSREILDQRKALIQESRGKTHKMDPYEAIREYILTGDPLDLDRIHAKDLSRRLNIPLDLVIDVCVRMVKEGNLLLTWDVVCPHCRGVKVNNNSLSSIGEPNSCGPCGITFDLDSESAIEVVFHVSPKLREIQTVVYCAAEPAKKKHIKLNQEVSPKDQKAFSLSLPPGKYNLRAKTSKGVVPIQITEDAPSRELLWDGKETKRAIVTPEFTLRIQNSTGSLDLFTLEEAWWYDDRLLAGEALSHPHLREIFSQDHISVGVKLNVGSQVILFTDIVGSTPFYKTLGDALAMKAVQNHYQDVSNVITKNSGIVVKYIGDAVMAAFVDIEKAMQAALGIQEAFNRTRSDQPIKLRVSLHEGKVLAANINVGIDYFGNTVNQAAKIQKHAGAFEIAVCDSDWERLKAKFPELKVSEEILDDKLGVSVRVLST